MNKTDMNLLFIPMIMTILCEVRLIQWNVYESMFREIFGNLVTME